ncbi:phospholipid/glycerol acyltransferase [Catenulispora acidiphila DSM 44928]|uniref:Phospholipid/glycerol acyltransferase n=1 Tax=Catenulispora acidiphila (strain DSM 44928 / JCM 14897 / NBRC 102108 / NRRL B-24433 / ID139908) TaxID=479433 RepID=C7PZW5_CATAD|nr:lysophospholipid acyltransferase family protein [Catenulispora acidiphila]ACU73630.1 phospholipid/glycerol acyltransferase [Catenulispora acidiphila DSM 44928]
MKNEVSAQMSVYQAAKFFVEPLVKVVYRPRVEGLENIPASGAAILAANHLSFSDSFFIPVVVPRHVTFIAKVEYFNTRGLKGMWNKYFYARFAGAVPIDRSGTRNATTAALEGAVAVLQAGGLFGIYPEGTRSPDGKLYRGRTGIAEIALRSGAPIIPIGIVGTDRVQPPGKKFPRLSRVTIRIGAPLDLAEAKALAKPALVRRAITDEVIEQIQKLSGQEYRPVYASDVKEGKAAA